MVAISNPAWDSGEQLHAFGNSPACSRHAIGRAGIGPDQRHDPRNRHGRFRRRHSRRTGHGFQSRYRCGELGLDQRDRVLHDSRPEPGPVLSHVLVGWVLEQGIPGSSTGGAADHAHRLRDVGGLGHRDRRGQCRRHSDPIREDRGRPGHRLQAHSRNAAQRTQLLGVSQVLRRRAAVPRNGQGHPP